MNVCTVINKSYWLLQSNFRSTHDFVTWVYVKLKGEDVGDGTDMYELVIDQVYLESLAGPFCLCYYSYRKDCIVGYSDIFKVTDVFIYEVGPNYYCGPLE